jgi:two-component system, chemotaxis family, CheB/CheR fusion protein
MARPELLFGAGAELHHITGMPDAYARYVDGFAIGTQSLACGLAVATRQPVITRDVRLAEEFHYRACWSFPVAIGPGKVLGSFAMYYEGPREPTMRDLDLASFLTRTAATIISRN